MESYHGNQNSVKSRMTPSGMKCPTHEHLERALHDDFETGLYCWGDVDCWRPEQWPSSVDNWFFETTNLDHSEQDTAYLADADAHHERDVNNPHDETELEMILTGVEHERAILDQEYEESIEEIDFEEFHRWLDSLEPTIGELEARDMSDCGFGHQA